VGRKQAAGATEEEEEGGEGEEKEAASPVAHRKEKRENFEEGEARAGRQPSSEKEGHDKGVGDEGDAGDGAEGHGVWKVSRKKKRTYKSLLEIGSAREEQQHQPAAAGGATAAGRGRTARTARRAAAAGQGGRRGRRSSVEEEEECSANESTPHESDRGNEVIEAEVQGQPPRKMLRASLVPLAGGICAGRREGTWWQLRGGDRDEQGGEEVDMEEEEESGSELMAVDDDREDRGRKGAEVGSKARRVREEWNQVEEKVEDGEECDPVQSDYGPSVSETKAGTV
jgi:hypothetical protein